MADSMRADWSTLIFVSTATPRASLVELAREASRAGAVLVFRGFAQEASQGQGTAADLQGLQAFVAAINAQCCADSKGSTATWIVDPRLFDRYKVRTAPTFVVAWGDADRKSVV